MNRKYLASDGLEFGPTGYWVTCLSWLLTGHGTCIGFGPVNRALLLCEDQHLVVEIFSVTSELKRVQAKDENEYTDFHM